METKSIDEFFDELNKKPETFKEKLKEWWEDNVVWYLWDKPKSAYRTIRHWLYTCGKYKSHWKFAYNALFHNYPWDYCFFYHAQYDWIKKSYDYFNDKCWCGEYKQKSILRYQKICLGLLDIILENANVADYDLKEHKTILHRHVNLRNRHRFPIMVCDYRGNTHMSSEFHERFPEEYYKYKAQYLYFKILNERSGEWWD